MLSRLRPHQSAHEKDAVGSLVADQKHERAIGAIDWVDSRTCYHHTDRRRGGSFGTCFVHIDDSFLARQMDIWPIRRLGGIGKDSGKIGG